MTDRLNVAVVGAGIAALHLAAFRWTERFFDVRVLCTRDDPRAGGLMQEYGIPEHVEDFDALLTRADIDVIDICTPPDRHFAMCEKALRAGKHVICEKPLFGSVAECDRMSEIERESGRRLMPIFQYRYGSGLQKLRMLVRAGLTGQPFLTTIETHWWRDADYYAVDWRGHWAGELGGGLLGHAIHAHDMLTYIHGPCDQVFAHVATLVNEIEVEDTAALSIRMANGSLAALSMTLGSREEVSRLRFAFRDLTAESIRAPYHAQRDPWTFVCGDAAHQERVDAALATYEAKEDGYTRQFELLAEALAGGRPPPVTIADARASMELVTAAYASHRDGIPHALPITPAHPLYASWRPG
ncbi:Gfo/Idh/MocA family oxidoreductase [Jannaschia sp. S6380]|uniref:Gfo/Idh/MocA family protein n=1 Tax=Jannaschia sp. S6380 TaxID=2926408 RepID=UPI001FF1471A|nr:Gfo/Idh/MocA family oxidoreductase [Jannaschia sp. S6380]MCK0166780.1 Gfo/Idh/MocA family oxidoreductase [Jannaschia sp. S6380]